MGTLRLGSSVVVPSVTVNTSTPPVIQSLSVTPSTSSQTITAPSGVDGYSPISVSAVDNTIDSNITANNIKSGVTILGVTGNVVELDGEQISITPTTSQQIITPTSPKNGITQATVSAVTSSIDNNIQAGNIKSGVSILGVSGTVTELNGETQSVSLTSAAGDTFTPTTGKNAITSITVTPTNENRTVNPSTSSQSLTVNSGYSGNGTITVNPVTSSIDANITAGNIKKDVSILGVTGTYEGSGGTLITKTITENGTYDAQDDNADGYSQVTVNVSAGSRLPNSYTELAYIFTDSNAYINTGINIANTDVIESEFQNASSSSSGYGALYGIYSLGESSALYASGTYYGYDSTNSQVNTGITVDINWHKAIHNFVDGTLHLDNTTVSFTPFTFVNSVPCGLGARYYNGSYGYFWKGSIKTFKIERGSSLICDFVPAKRKSDDVVGMYDLVSDTFFTNANNTGTFIAGPVVDPGGIIPSGTLPITQNGTYDVTSYAYANINVSGGASSVSVAKSTSNNKLTNTSVTNIINLTGITDIDDYVLYYAYYNGYSLSGKVDFSDLTTISGNYACQNTFSNCSNIEEVDLSSLQTISGNYACQSMFSNCNKIETIDLSNLTTVSGYGACNNMFNSCSSLINVDLSNLTAISNTYGCQNMFYGCTNLTSVDLSALTNINPNYSCYNMFNSCSSLTNVDISSVTTINGYQGAYTMFAGTNIASIDLSSLTAIDGVQACYGMFSGCTHLSSVNLSSLSSITGTFSCLQMFSGCTSLSSLSFPALTSTSFGSYTNQFNNMLSGVTGCTVHFPSNLQSVIGSWSSVQNGFGGTNTTVLFDLPATE